MFDLNQPNRCTVGYVSPEIEALPLGMESGFASSGKWDDYGKSSPDFSVNSVYDGEFE